MSISEAKTRQLKIQKRLDVVCSKLKELNQMIEAGLAWQIRDIHNEIHSLQLEQNSLEEEFIEVRWIQVHGTVN